MTTKKELLTQPIQHIDIKQHNVVALVDAMQHMAFSSRDLYRAASIYELMLRDGNRVRHFCIVTNQSDPEGGSGLDLIRWHRQKAGTIEHAHDVLMNELAGAALPSQKFGANAAWFRLNVMLYNLLSAFKRVAMPPDLHRARPDGRRCARPAGIAAVSNPDCARLPSLEPAEPAASASLDLAQVDAALAQLTALDALKGEAAAAAYGAHLLYGELLQHLGPLTLRAQEARSGAAAAELSLHLPLR